AVVAAEHARQAPAPPRFRHGGVEQAAEPAHGELLAPLGGRGRKDRSSRDRQAAAAERFDNERHQRGRRLGAARLRTSEPPRRTDQLDLSSHVYAALRRLLQRVAERATETCCPMRSAAWRDMEAAWPLRSLKCGVGRTGRASRSACGLPCRRGSRITRCTTLPPRMPRSAAWGSRSPPTSASAATISAPNG